MKELKLFIAKNTLPTKVDKCFNDMNRFMPFLRKFKNLSRLIPHVDGIISMMVNDDDKQEDVASVNYEKRKLMFGRMKKAT
jgi:predicted fused transcriptional regulator/phosphomethylpyrimidine kinase